MSQQSILQLARGRSGYRAGDNCWRIVGRTGTLDAALAQGSVLFGLRAAPNTPSNVRAAYIERLRIQYTCLVSFTTPITAGRALAFAGITNATITGGSSLTPQPKGSSNSNIDSIFSAPGQARIASTAALGGVTSGGSTAGYGYASLAALGTAGNRETFEWTFSGDDTAPIAISSGGGIDASLLGLGIYLPQAMDATGQFELVVEVDTCELPKNYIPEFP